jgi:hypothetical protein
MWCCRVWPQQFPIKAAANTNMDAKEIQTSRHAEKPCESTGTWRSTREWKESVFEYRLKGDSECRRLLWPSDARAHTIHMSRIKAQSAAGNDHKTIGPADQTRESLE